MSLPAICLHIISNFISSSDPLPLSKLELAQYASVNRNWQAVVEERSWATLRVKTGTPLSLDQFERLTNDPRRQSYIRNIELIVELEPYDEAARAHFETESEHERNN
ncbi:hypothetical protein N7495_003443 [Penicillium taxi]|uniref:uncharacterized protein n=1 Tax=Penicillium taxi TaxID=168475 RepID=UPI00254538FF|nr:uncharacterized protein N7495_003443 [Penicillium taxi]KAJ5902915.1 hypothetical protein N7495_003443 [Penicillium taxi]